MLAFSMKTKLIVAAAALLLIYGGIQLHDYNQRQIGASQEKVKNLQGQINEKVKNDEAINNAENAGRDAAAAPDDCVSDSNCRE